MNNLYKEMVRKPGDLCFEVSLESDKGLTMTDLSFALKFFVYGHPKNVCIHKDDLEVVEGKYYAVINEHGFVNGVLFCEAEIVETINGINRIVSVRSNTGYMIGNCCQPSVDTSSCAHGYSLSLYKVEYVPQPIDPNPEEDQLVAEELFGERLSLPELTADRAIADEHGNRIADTYETRQAVRNHIRAVYNEQFIENPPLVTEGYITPQMLSEDVKGMLAEAGATITNLPDGEDLTAKQGVLKLSDKPYNPGAYSGLGRVYLRKNLVGGQNLLTQAMVSKPNTIYILQYDYTLDGKSITIPEGCVLDFQGGSLSNGIINGKRTLISSCDVKIFGLDITLDGIFSNDNIYTEWFGAVGDGNTDDLLYINKAIQVAKNIDATVKLQNKNYAINGTIFIGNRTRLHGDNVVGRFGFNTKIIQQGDFNVIEINNIKAFDDSKSYYTNISIKDICVDMNGHMVNGIHYKREDGDTNTKVLQFCTFSNLYLINGYNGIYFYLENNIDGLLDSEFWNINTDNNIIGLHFDGGTFINLNSFHGCYFSNNRNIGIRIKGSTLENNKFDTCSIEANGINYDEDTYQTYGTSGVTLIGQLGYNIFDNCYFENNYAIKNDVCPPDIDTNFYVANIVCQGVMLVSRNSIYANYNRGINVGGVCCGVELNGNDYWDPKAFSKNDSFVKIWNDKFNVIYGYQQFNFLDGSRDRIKIQYAFEFEKDSTTDLINYHIIDKSSFRKANNVIVKDGQVVSDTINLYIDGITDGTGFTEKVPAQSLESIKLKNIYLRNVKNKIIHIIGNCSTGAARPEYIKGDLVVIKGVQGYDSKLTFDSFIYNWEVENIVFEDLTIDLVSTFGLELCKIKKVTFSNCIINYVETDGHSLLRSSSSAPTFTVIQLYNTTVNDIVGGSSHNHFCSGNPKLYKFEIKSGTKISETIHMDDCDNIDFSNRDGSYINYPNGYFAYDKEKGCFVYFNNNKWSFLSSLPFDTPTVGSFSQKPTNVNVGFAFFCTDRNTEEGSINGIMIYHKGNNVWVDALGRVVE